MIALASAKTQGTVLQIDEEPVNSRNRVQPGQNSSARIARWPRPSAIPPSASAVSSEWLALMITPAPRYTRQRMICFSNRFSPSLMMPPTSASTTSPANTPAVSNRADDCAMRKPIPRLDDMNSPTTAPISE